MAETEYKVNLRNSTNDGWVNVLTETNIVMVDPSNIFLGDRLDDVLYELRTAILEVGGGGPGYLGEPLHVIDLVDSTGPTDEIASISTRGGMSIAKNVNAGGLGVTGTTILGDDTTITGGDLLLDQDISGVVTITGSGLGDITDFVNITLTGSMSGDTLTVTTSVNSALSPDVDDSYNLGGAIRRWANLYATNVMASIIVGDLTGNVTGNVTGSLTGDVTGNVTGDLTGNVTGGLTGNVTGDLTGNVTGGLTGDVTGNVTGNVTGGLTGDVTGDLTGNVTGGLTGDVTGNVTGDVLSQDGLVTVLDNGTDGSDAVFTGDVTGDVTGDLIGNVTGDVTGNVTGDLTGNVTGGLTGDVTGNVTGNVTGGLTGDVTGNVTGDLTGNVTGDVTGGLTGDVTGDVTGNVTGDLTGNVTGNVTGGLTGDVTGDLTGNVTGNVTGDVTGNVTGDLTGDMTGTVTGDLIGSVDGDVTGNVTGAVLSQDGLVTILNNGSDGTDAVFTGDVTGDLTGDVTGNVTGDLTGNVTGGLTGDVVGSEVNVTDVIADNGDIGSLVVGTVGSSLIPEDGYGIGTELNKWSSLYTVQLLGAANIESDVATIGTLNVTTINSSSFVGDFNGDLTGNVIGDLTGSLIGSTTQVTSGWDLVSDVGTADALDVVGGVHVGKSLTVDEKVFIGGDLNVTGDITGSFIATVPWTNVQSNVISDVTNTRDIGSTTNQWANIYSVNVDSETADIVNLTVNTLVLTTVGSDLIPDTTRNIGSVGSKWGSLYVNNILGSTNIESDIATIGTLNVTTINGSEFTGSFTGDLDGNVVGNVTGNIDGNVDGNLIGDTSQVTSAWDKFEDGDLNDSLEIRGGMTVDKNLNVGRTLNIGQDLHVTGSLSASSLTLPSVMTDLTGNIKSQDGVVVVVENGTDGSDAVFTGQLDGNLNGNIVSASSSFTELSGGNIITSGEATVNSLNVLNVVESNLIPLGSFTLGNQLNRWNEIYGTTITGSSFVGGTFTGSFMGNLGLPTTSSNNFNVVGDLDVTGEITGGQITFSVVTSNVVGDVLSQDGLVTVLDNGTDGTDATFLGDVTGNIQGDLTGNIVSPVTTHVTSTTDSTSWDTGSLILDGGQGIAGNLNVQGDIHTLGNMTIGAVFDAPNFIFLNGVISGNVQSVNKDTGALVITQGGIGVEQDINVGGSVGIVTDLNVSGLTTLDDNTQINGIVDINNDVDVDMTDGDFDVVITTGNFSVDVTTGNVDITTNQTLTVEGDVVDIHGISTVNLDTTDLVVDTTSFVITSDTNTINGTLNVNDDLNIGSDNTDTVNINSKIGTTLYSFDNTQSLGSTGDMFNEAYFNRFIAEGGNTTTNTTTGDIVTAGGIGVGENLYVGSNTTIVNDLGVGGNTTLTGTLLVTNDTQSIDVITGSIVTAGGMGIGRELFVGGQVNALSGFIGDITGNVLGDVQGDVQGSLVGETVEADVITSNISLYVGSTSELAGIVTITDTTGSTGKDSGALVVDGGVGIEENLHVGGSVTIGTTFEAPDFVFQFGEVQGSISSTDKDTGAVVITQGGLGVEENVNVGGYVNVVGNISTTSGTIGGLTAVELTQLNNIDSVTITNGQWVYVGDMNQSVTTTDNVTFNAVKVNDTTTSTNKDTGALVVEGGVGIEENLNVGGNTGFIGNVTVSGDLTVNGTTTTINSTTVRVEDNIMVVNAGEIGAGVTIGTAGIEVDRGSEANFQFIFDESDDLFRVGKVDSLQAVATREDTPKSLGTAIWDDTTSKFITINWESATDAQTLVSGRKYLADGSISSLVLPISPVQGHTIIIHDEMGDWFNSPVFIDRNGNNIMGVADDLVLNTDNATVELVFTTSKGWKIV